MTLSMAIGWACAAFALAWLVMIWAAWRIARRQAWGDFKTGWKAGWDAARTCERLTAGGGEP